MSWSESILRLCVLILMTVMGIQDLRARRVSNYLTVPFFFAGLLANALRFFNAAVFEQVVFFQAIVIFAAYYGWMGGADMKVFVGLLGLFPMLGLIALCVTGMWGAVVWTYSQNRDATFPAVTVSAFAVALTMIAGRL